MYSEALVTGSIMKIIIRRPVYPEQLVPIVTSGTDQGRYIPTTPSQGFWYIRYCYNRATDQSPPPPHTSVGHPVVNSNGTSARDVSIWASMRDFMVDPTVTWVRDRPPKVTSLEYDATVSQYAMTGDSLFGNGVKLDTDWNQTPDGQPASV
ncbi:MAG: hypothetical protein QXT77_09140, partial [Candidatus Methanomethylicaceae archaeon]